MQSSKADVRRSPGLWRTADVTDFQRLNEMIAKLRSKQRSPGEGRTLAGASAEARLAALVTEIDETILPRRLIFQWDEGSGIQLAVANRRLQGVLSPCVEDLVPFAGQPFSDPEAPLIGNVKDALLSILDKAPQARIKSVHLGKDDLGSDAGIAADALSRLWSLADGSGEVGVGDALPNFLKSLSANSTAWLSVEGEEVADQGGDASEIARLGDTAAYLLDAYLNRKEAVFGSDELPKAYAVSGPKTGLFFGDTGEQTVFVLTKPNDLVPVVSAWRASFG